MHLVLHCQTTFFFIIGSGEKKVWSSLNTHTHSENPAFGGDRNAIHYYLIVTHSFKIKCVKHLHEKWTLLKITGPFSTKCLNTALKMASFSIHLCLQFPYKYIMRLIFKWVSDFKAVVDHVSTPLQAGFSERVWAFEPDKTLFSPDPITKRKKRSGSVRLACTTGIQTLSSYACK